MNGTISLEDMRLFAVVAGSRSFTAAAHALGVPKQTLSRRIAALEASLAVQLLHRTTRRLRLSDVGSAYAARCAELVRLADEANRSVTDAPQEPCGVLRVSADPVFGEAFVGDIALEFSERWPAVEVEVLLTRRRVDLIEEGFDLAFRVGGPGDPALRAIRLGPARVRTCASPDYVARRGAPADPRALAGHDCIVVVGEDGSARWPFRGPDGAPMLVAVHGRVRVNASSLAHAAALRGLGIALYPEFACAAALRSGALVSLLDAYRVEVGGVWLVYPAVRFQSARVRAFVALARERLAQVPWAVEDGAAAP